MPDDIDTQVRDIGRGLVQVNLRLSRILKAVETSADGGRDGSPLDVLLDLIDALTMATRLASLPTRRRWWQLFTPPAPTPDERLAGVALAREHTLARLETMGIRPIDTDGVFDPNVHQAVARRTTDDPDLYGMIAVEHRPGWGRERGGSLVVMRAAQVTVYVHGDPGDE